MSVEAEVDRLYGLALDEFTKARDQLADRLRASGDKEGALAVKSLKKPNLPAWVVNQLARRRSNELRELLALRGRLEKAREANQLREAAEARKRLLAELVEDAGSILAEGGHRASAATMQRVWDTLRGGATERERLQLLKGRLVRELSSSGFEQALTSASEDAAGGSSVYERARRKAEELAEEAALAEREAESLERAAEGLRREAQRAAIEAERAEGRAALARRKAVEARARADGAGRDST